MPLLKEHSCTIDDIYALPAGQRAELIDGQIYMMGAPSYLHQTLAMELSSSIRDYIRQKKGPCQVLQSPLAVALFADDKTYVEPDISVICDKNKITGKGINGAPDFIIEIVAPATQSLDYGIKLFKYRTAGVREYWIINPMKEIVNVYDFEKDAQTGLYSFDDVIPVSIYPDFSIRISDLLN